VTDTSILEDTKEENGKRVLQDLQDLFPLKEQKMRTRLMAFSFFM